MRNRVVLTLWTVFWVLISFKKVPLLQESSSPQIAILIVLGARCCKIKKSPKPEKYSLLFSSSKPNQHHLLQISGKKPERQQKTHYFQNKLKCWNGLLILLQRRAMQSSSRVFWNISKTASSVLQIAPLQCDWVLCAAEVLCSAMFTGNVQQRLAAVQSSNMQCCAVWDWVRCCTSFSPNLPLTGHLHHPTLPVLRQKILSLPKYVHFSQISTGVREARVQNWSIKLGEV